MQNSKLGTKNALTRVVAATGRFAEIAVETVWPEQCLVCGTPTISRRRSPFDRNPPLASLFCPDCRRRLVSPTSTFCVRCGGIVPPGVVGPRCGRCADDDWYFSAALPLHSYVGLARAVVLRLKRSKDRALVSAVARLYYESRKKELLAFKPDCVVATPMFWRRKYLLRRGVNAPEGLAKRLAYELDVPCLSRYLKRVRATAAQTSVGWSQRAVNIRGAFAVRTRHGAPIFIGRRVLLVDDALTSGATCDEIAKTLLEAGAESVCVATLTRAGLGRRPRPLRKQKYSNP